VFSCPECSADIPKWKSAMVGAKKIDCENCGAILQPTKSSKEKLDKMTTVGVVAGVGGAAFAVSFGNFLGVFFAFALLFLLACVYTVFITEFEVVDS
jgi:hypothetical protein